FFLQYDFTVPQNLRIPFDLKVVSSGVQSSAVSIFRPSSEQIVTAGRLFSSLRRNGDEKSLTLNRMNVSLAYHLGGKFATVDTELVYEGGKVVTITEVDPDMINLFDLEVVIKSQLSYSHGAQMYFNVPNQLGVSKFRLIHNDDSLLDMLSSYKNMEIYHIYVEHEVEDDVGEEDDASDDAGEEGDVDSEIGSCISEEDREELEAVKTKVKEVRQKLEGGIKFAISDDDSLDGDHSDGFGSDEIGYYEKTDSEDEVADHGVRMKEPLDRYNPNTDIPFFELGMTFTDAAEVRAAIKKHAITERKDVKFEKNEPKRMRLKCKRLGCRWKFFVSHNKRFNCLQDADSSIRVIRVQSITKTSG
ncbi:hypothetical protein LINPERHAP1_LOCUS7129, partial [Linum perenne]